MLRRRKMLDKKNICSPWKLGWVLRAAHDEARFGRAASGLDEQIVQHALSILRIRAEIRERAPIHFLRRDAPMHVGIDAAVERRNFLCAQLEFERIKRRSTREAQN